MNRQKTFLHCILSTSLCLWAGVGLAREFVPLPANSQVQLSKPETFLLQGMLGEMGLSLPDDNKREVDPEPAPRPSPAPSPTPRPAPEPRPAPADDDDFFDDDFFDNDAGFDDIVEQMDAEFEETVAAWDREYEETVARWDRARVEYQQRKEQHLQATFDYNRLEPLAAGATQADLASGGNLNTMAAGDFHVIAGALAMRPQNQAYRGTCAAFTGVRALETMLMQHNIVTDLSEQHFYFLSRPDCRSAPCAEPKSSDGSRFETGLVASMSNPILLEEYCPYKPFMDKRNLTYTPLRECSPDGRAVSGTPMVGPFGVDSIWTELQNNRPVLAGFKLTNSYVENKGLVTSTDSRNASRSNNSHAGGHANLLIGFVRLPESLAREGKFCAIAVNSWGTGWGRGGHACLTERWLKENQIVYGSLRSVSVTDNFIRKYELN